MFQARYRTLVGLLLAVLHVSGDVSESCGPVGCVTCFRRGIGHSWTCCWPCFRRGVGHLRTCCWPCFRRRVGHLRTLVAGCVSEAVSDTLKCSFKATLMDLLLAVFQTPCRTLTDPCCWLCFRRGVGHLRTCCWPCFRRHVGHLRALVAGCVSDAVSDTYGPCC